MGKAAEASGPSLSRTEGVLNSWIAESGARSWTQSSCAWLGWAVSEQSPQPAPLTSGLLPSPGTGVLPHPSNAFIWMHLITQQRENGNGLAGGLSNERALGKLCLLHPGILKASHGMHVPFHFPIALSFLLFIFQNLNGISKGIEQ